MMKTILNDQLISVILKVVLSGGKKINESLK